MRNLWAGRRLLWARDNKILPKLIVIENTCSIFSHTALSILRLQVIFDIKHILVSNSEYYTSLSHKYLSRSCLAIYIRSSQPSVD